MDLDSGRIQSDRPHRPMSSEDGPLHSLGPFQSLSGEQPHSSSASSPDHSSSSRFALRCLLKASTPIACVPVPDTSDCVLVGESTLWRLRFADGTLNCVKQADLYDVALCALLLPNRPDSIAILVNTSRIMFFNPDLVLSRQCIYLPDESPFSRPSRLMVANDDGSRFAIASFETDLWIVSPNESDPSDTKPFRLSSTPMAMEFIDSTRLVVFLSSEAGSERVCLIQVAPQQRVVFTISTPWSGEVIDCSRIPSSDHTIIVFSESKISLLDLEKKSFVCSKDVPIWQPSNCGHRPIQNSAPLLSALHLCDGRILASFESGDLFHIAINDSNSFELHHLGVVNPGRTLASFPTAATSNAAFRTPGNTTAVCLFGDFCDGCLFTINNWFPSYGLSSISVLDSFPTFSPILDADFLSVEDQVIIGCQAGKHGRISVLQYGLPFKSISNSSRGYKGLRRIISLQSGKSFQILLLCFVGSSRLLGITDLDGKYILNDISDQWNICQVSTTIATSPVYHHELLCQVYEYGIRIVRCQQPGTTESIISDTAFSEPIVAASILESGNVLIGSGKECCLYWFGKTKQDPPVLFNAHSHPSSDVTALKLCSESVNSKSLIWAIFCYSNGSAQLAIPDADLDFHIASTLNEGSSDEGSFMAVECIELLRSQTNDMIHIFLGRRDGKIDRYFYPISAFHKTLQAQESVCFCAPQTIELGEAPVAMTTVLDRCGIFSLLVICEKPFLIRTRGESVEVKQCTDKFSVQFLPGSSSKSASVAPFLVASGFAPGIFVVVCDDEMSIVEMERTLDRSAILHNSSIAPHGHKLNLTPRRLAHDPASNIIVCACTDSVEGALRSKLFLIDNTTGFRAAFGSLEQMESVQSLCFWDNDLYGKLLCIGTSVSSTTSAFSSSRGRLLCYRLSENTGTRLRHSKDDIALSSAPISRLREVFGAAVLSIAAMNKRSLCVAFADSVHVMKISSEDIVSQCKVKIQDLVVYISCRALSEEVGQIMVCGSRGFVQLLRYQTGPNACFKIISTNRSLHPATRCAILPDGNEFVADKMGSISIINPAAKTAFYEGFLYLGETVCKIVAKEDNRHLIFTLSGSVYEVQSLRDELVEKDSRILEELQSSIIRQFNISPRYRSGSHPLKSFIDIDLLSKWLDLPFKLQHHLLESISFESRDSSVQYVLSLLDRLSR